MASGGVVGVAGSNSGRQARIGHGPRIAVGVGEADRVDRAPEQALVLVLPADDRRVGGGQRDHAEQARGLRAAEPVTGRQVAHEAAVDHQRLGLPEDRRHRLVRGPVRAVELAEALDLLEVARIGAAGELVRAVREEPAGARDEERAHVADPPRRFDRGLRRRDAPLAGRGALRERVRGAGRQPAVVRARGQHRRGRRLAGSDPAVLRRARPRSRPATRRSDPAASAAGPGTGCRARGTRRSPRRRPWTPSAWRAARAGRAGGGGRSR